MSRSFSLISSVNSATEGQVLAHQHLISLLLPLLQSTARETSQPTRLLTLSSFGHLGAPKSGIDYTSLIRPSGASDADTFGLEIWTDYGQSKWGDIALAKYVDLHYGPGKTKDGEIIATAIHPGKLFVGTLTPINSDVVRIHRHSVGNPSPSITVDGEISPVACGESIAWHE